jgi:hypothetical protein
MSGLWIGTLASAGGLVGDFESIASITVGSGGASTIEFTSIPQTYQHLQIRGVIAQTGSNASGGWDYVIARFNSDNGNNYTNHYLIGSGSSANASGYTGQSGASVAAATLTGGISIFPAFMTDILDYGTSTKNVTVRSFYGAETNTSTSEVGLSSSLWINTAAVTSVTLSGFGSLTFAQHTTVALYGVKAP